MQRIICEMLSRLVWCRAIKHQQLTHMRTLTTPTKHSHHTHTQQTQYAHIEHHSIYKQSRAHARSHARTHARAHARTHTHTHTMITSRFVIWSVDSNSAVSVLDIIIISCPEDEANEFTIGYCFQFRSANFFFIDVGPYYSNSV